MIDINNMTVLIVDDMVSMCKSIQKMMQVIQYGKEFFLAHNGKEALDILQEKPVDLLLLDYNMPVMSGMEALHQIREDRSLRDLPVIMVTAEAYTDFVAEAGESMIDAYILKPITIKLMQDKVSFVVETANNPPPMIFYLKRARDFEDDGEMDAAIREAKLAMEANPNATRPIRELGYYYYKKDDLKEAERWLLKAAKMNYLDVFAFHYLGETYLKLNDIEKASHYFEKAMEISPRHLSRGINFGKTLVQMKMVTKAIQVFDKTLALSGSTLELKEEIVNFCIGEEVNEYAVKLLESIVEELPDRADLLFKLAIITEKLGDTMRAVTFLVRSGEIDKENADIKIHLAKIYLSLNKPILAEVPLKKILKTNPDNELARELLQQCT